MEFKDYYKILGLEPNADEKKIKSAYRKLARQHHPDVNPGDKASVEKFKEINEAYQVVSDPEQRKKYDQMRAQYEQWQKQGGRPQDFNPEYPQWQGGPGGPGAGRGPATGSTRGGYASAEDMEDLFGADSPFSDFFQSNFGGGARGAGGSAGTPRPRRGRDLEYEVEVSLEEAFHGAKRMLQIGERRIEATIPRGVQSGSRIRLAGQAEPGRNGGPAGDLYLITQVLPHPKFEREGDDLFTDVPVDFYTAALGGEVRVQTLDGAVMLKVEARTQAGRSIRLRGKGMPRLSEPAKRGDLFARITIVLPEPLSEHELQTLRELHAAREKTETR